MAAEVKSAAAMPATVGLRSVKIIVAGLVGWEVSKHRASCDRDRLIDTDRGAVVVNPGEIEDPAFLDPHRKLQIRIGGDRRFEVACEHWLPVEAAREAIDDITRNELATLILPLAVLHDMGDQRLDLDDVTFLAFFR